MNHDSISVATPAMAKAAEGFVRALGSARGSLGGVEQEIHELSRAWRSDAGRLFGDSLKGWCGEFHKICIELERILATLQANKGNYQSMEAGAEAEVAGLKLY